MAQQDTFFDRIRRLFSTNVIVRNIGGKKLKIVDTDAIQAGSRTLMDRYQKLYSSGLGAGGYQYAGEMAKMLKISLFRDYEAMDDDSILSSALDIYADESTMKSEFGNVLEIKTENEQIREILNNLFYDILNIEFNLWPWVRNMCKYGDFYLFLDIAEDYGVVNVEPLSPYDISRVEGENPDNPHEIKFVMDQADPRTVVSMTTKKELENFEIAHFRLLSDSNYLPYGKSMIEGARKVWKQLSLMEDAMLIHRIMRAPEKRVFKIDIGNLPPSEVDTYMKRIIDKMKKAPVIDENTGDYNLKYNMQNLTEDFYLPVRGGDSGTGIDNLAGLTYEAVDDIEYLRNKLLAALKVPKAFLGYEEQVGSKATLAAEDVRFARTIERIQRIVVSELTKIAVAHLYSQGYTDSALVDFDLELTNPSTIYEQERLELWEKKQNLARDMKSESLVSEKWIYDNVFNFTQDQIEDVNDEVVEDKKKAFRLASIENEGNDPAKPPQEGQLAPQEASKDTQSEDEEEEFSRDIEDRDTYGVRDVLGKYDYAHSKKRSDKPISHNFRKSPLHLAHYDSLKKKFNNNEEKLINEVEKVEKDLNGKDNKN